MADYLKPNSAKSFNTQIKEVERKILNRQREVEVRAALLVEKIQQQIPEQIIVTPANLLLAGSIGFILGELTKCPPRKIHSTAHKRGAAETSPLKTMLNLITSARTLYAVLPLAWMMQSRYQTSTSSHIPEQQTKSTSTKRTRTSL